MIKSRLPFAQHRGIGPKTHRGSVLSPSPSQRTAPFLRAAAHEAPKRLFGVNKMGFPGPPKSTPWPSTRPIIDCACAPRDDTVQSWSIKKDGLTGKRVLEISSASNCPETELESQLQTPWSFRKDGRGVVVGAKNGSADPPLSSGDAAFNWKEEKFTSETMGQPLFAAATTGCVYVCDTRSGKALETLSVGSPEWVQVVTTAEIDGVPVIFAAQMGALDHPEEIFFWKRARHRSIGWTKIRCMAFVCQNLQAAIKVIGKAELGGEEMTESLPVVGKAEFGGEQGSQVV
ncbi:hypothetical protein C8R43DRAFT_954763 [Mycena crocata]|nr:hypothetical protein C8R43DRAFT_954763 [Mycena crocata]